MIINCLNPWRRTARLVTTFAIVVLASTCVARAQTQPPYALFQNSALTGSGNTINATRVPVVISSSLTIYVDLTIQFNVDSNGNLTLTANYPQVAPSPVLLTGNFKAGTYVGPPTFLGGKALITVTGPGVLDGGVTSWVVSTAAGASGSTCPTTATFYAGPIASNPLATRLTAAKITSTAWSYGFNGTSTCSNNNWLTGGLIGVSQIGNTITIASFTAAGYIGSSDYNTPQDQVTFTLAQ